MKTIRAVMMTGIFLLLTGLYGYAQDNFNHDTMQIGAGHLAVTYAKTTNLLFPYPIKSVDRGSLDILVQKANGVENVLQVKAARPDFEETNLTVVTSDGSLYHYLVNYNVLPNSFDIRVMDSGAFRQPGVVFTPDATNSEIQSLSEKVNTRQRSLHKPFDDKYDIRMDVKGIYVHGDVLYLQLQLRNNAAVNYTVQSLRFYIRDKKRAKRTATQELEINPLYTLGEHAVIRDHSEQTVTVALLKFTIPDKKQCVVQLMEANGGRHLEFRLGNKDILKARPVF